jgi:hypothetical protein
MLVIRSMASFIVNSKGLKMHDIKQQLDIIWDALEAYRSDLIPEGDEQFDEIWGDICTAMAVIQEDLRVTE